MIVTIFSMCIHVIDYFVHANTAKIFTILVNNSIIVSN